METLTTVLPATIGKASELGVGFFEDTAPVTLRSNPSSEDVDLIIRAVYRQVLGNAHVMESERLVVPESQLVGGEISVREFVRQVAKSELYRSRFFDKSPRLRFIELNFKHLLGRAPESHEELILHSQTLDEGGLEAEIDSYLNSDEYLDAFGEDIVPYYRGYRTQTGRNVVGFTHLFQLLRGSSGSDAANTEGVFPGSQTRPRLQRSLLTNAPSAIHPLSAPSNTQPTVDAQQVIAKALNLKTYSSSPVSTPVTPSVAKPDAGVAEALQRQYQAFEEGVPIELWPGRSEEEVEIVIRATYRHVLGNAHVMESERLTVPESQLKLGEISVREFVRQVAKSELYRSRFFDNCPRYRSIELNFKHLLGRAPDDYSETFAHSQILDRGGFEAEIDSYLDSDEYQDAFGENTVPYYRGYRTQTGRRLLGFTNAFKLQKSQSTSDKAGVEGMQSRLVKPLIYNNPGGNVPVTDVQALIAEALTRKPWEVQAPGVAPQTSQVESDLQRKSAEQEALIETLQKQLAELQPFSGIGQSLVNQWQSVDLSSQDRGFSFGVETPEPSDPLQKQVEEQASLIAELEAKIADSRRFAAIGEARLNKWRSRSFSG